MSSPRSSARRVPAYAAPAVAQRDKVTLTFSGGVGLSIIGTSGRKYDVTFTDRATGRRSAKVVTAGESVRIFPAYFVPWTVRVQKRKTGEVLFEHQLDLRGERVLVNLQGHLGDTVAWFPYVEQFASAHGCRVIAGTGYNELFRASYPAIEFVTPEPGVAVRNLYACYDVSWYADREGVRSDVHHPREPRALPLQQTATDILGLPFRELRPRLGVRWSGARSGVIGISTHAALQMKYYDRPGGWDAVVSRLLAQGYQVKIFSNEPDGHRGYAYPAGASRLRDYQWSTVLEELAQCEAFIGLDSGPVWLAWAVGVPTAAILSASPRWGLPSDVLRVESEQADACRGCMALRSKLDWDACPEHRADAHRFECSRTIAPAQILAAVAQLVGAPRRAGSAAAEGGEG